MQGRGQGHQRGENLLLAASYFVASGALYVGNCTAGSVEMAFGYNKTSILYRSIPFFFLRAVSRFSARTSTFGFLCELSLVSLGQNRFGVIYKTFYKVLKLL